MSNQQQQPRQWFRFGSFFQGVQLQQTRPPAPTTPTQQPAIRPPAQQNAQETPRPIGAPIEVPVLRFPVVTTPAPVSAPAPRLPNPPQAATPVQIRQPAQIVRPAALQIKPLVFQPTPRAETPPGRPARSIGASNEATIMRSAAPMLPSAPAQSIRSPVTSTPVSRSPPKAALSHSPPPETTNAATPYSSPISRTLMQTSPSKEASPGIVFIRSSSMPRSPVRELSEPTSLLTSPVPEPPSPSRSPPPSLAFPAKSSNQERTPKTSPEYVKPVPEYIRFRQTSHPPSSGNDQAEQKSVLVQETLDRSRVTPGKGDPHDQNFPGTTKIKNGGKEKGKTIPKKLPDSGNFGTSLMLNGVNRGAIMDISNGDKKESSIFRGIGKKLGSGLDGGKEETNNPNHKKGMSIQTTGMRALINNNVQGINNSIVYNSSCREKDPGVHLSISRKGNFGKEEILRKDQSK